MKASRALALQAEQFGKHGSILGEISERLARIEDHLGVKRDDESEEEEVGPVGASGQGEEEVFRTQDEYGQADNYGTPDNPPIPADASEPTTSGEKSEDAVGDRPPPYPKGDPAVAKSQPPKGEPPKSQPSKGQPSKAEPPKKGGPPDPPSRPKKK